MEPIREQIEKLHRYTLDLVASLTNQASLVTLYSFLIISTSIFTYISIYSIYVPIVQQTRPVYFQFDSKCKTDCNHPFATVDFHDVRSKFHLARGQAYKFNLELAMPESDINMNQGIFMIRLKLIESQGKILYDISRPAMLKHRTLVTRVIKALVLSPFLITNYKNEMQTLNVQIIDNYIEGAKHYFDRIDRAFVELLAKDLQVYSANLHVVANLSGLSYYMYHWPISSAISGIATIAGFMSLVSIY